MTSLTDLAASAQPLGSLSSAAAYYAPP